ncbi:Rieske (2Fe-2S) protein [Glutamicibacter ectropisis]|uniref:Cytochrome bc1 complex Rieske iron-sulfur subunit n=1 Tax=Glutamicibacter ectropisis TaxID=3046593 RepID=A0AAU6WC27_9MICC
MTDFAQPARRTVMCASAALGSVALLTACGDGHSEAQAPEASPVPSPTGEGQAVIALSEIEVGARATVQAKHSSGAEIPVLLFRPDEKTVLAYSSVCTHQGCVVTTKSTKEDFFCACHGSRFQPSDGTVTDGPAIAPLGRYATEIKDDQVVVFITES